ncbi:MAG: GAF domain-containing protein, partial [Flavobacteriales bacterium]
MSNSSDSQQHYLELLSRFSADLIGKTKVEDVLWCITENAIAELGFEDCVVYLLSESGEYLIQKAAYGPKKGEKQEVVEPIKIEVGTGVVGHVAKTGVAEIVKDCSLDPRYIEDDAVRNSEITVPILKDGQVIGIIDSEHSQTGYYTEEHLSVLRAIAEIATIRLTQIKFTSSVVRDKELLAEEVAETKEELQMAMRQLQKSNDQLEVMV